jgi:hypothetical protein
MTLKEKKVPIVGEFLKIATCFCNFIIIKEYAIVASLNNLYLENFFTFSEVPSIGSN